MTRPFDVYRNPVRAGREYRPFVLVLQHAFFDELPTRVVVPLILPASLQMQPRLNPAFIVRGQAVHLSPTEPFSLPLRLLRDFVANLEQERHRIVGALDLVFTGI